MNIVKDMRKIRKQLKEDQIAFVKNNPEYIIELLERSMSLADKYEVPEYEGEYPEGSLAYDLMVALCLDIDDDGDFHG